jgi:hypothetical protein
MSIYLTPLRDLTLEVVAKNYVASGTSIAQTPITSGAMSAFLATSNSPTASAADASLVGTCTHVGTGHWLVTFDAAILTASLLATHFAAATPYCIVQIPSEFRDYVTLTYRASAPATIP